MFINKEIYNYIYSTIKNTEPKYLKKIRKLKKIKKKIMSNKIQGRFLSFFSKIKNPNTILEIGTYLGYSALCLSEGLKKNGYLLTIEKNKLYFKIAKKNINKTKYKKNINIILGNALKILPKIKKKFDIVFIDADKKNYINYFKLIKKNIKKRTLIIVDNVLWKGLVIKKTKDKFTNYIKKFNKFIKNNKKLNNIILPIRDGLNLIINN
ncbi:MAG: class I SAM-dependent methyltransferase [Candidatus Shikimatogenerans bostrichidophilus]|nr:MAG: class I SAM-dependent methyltransferase [Candidatus Shikimatogenerans bostrichidophilus]